MEELLSLKWNNHKSTFLHILTILRDRQLYTDATLACEGKFYSCHRLVLSTCSEYFSAMFDRTQCKNPIIVLKDIKCVDLEALLDYMYLGEVNVKQSELPSLIKAAECLQVKGLAVPDDEPPKRENYSNRRRLDNSRSSPIAKRKRREEDSSKPSESNNHVNAVSTIANAIPNSSPIRNSERNNISNENDKNILSIKTEDARNANENILLDNDDSFNVAKEHIKEEIGDENEDLDELSTSSDVPEFIQASGSAYAQSFDASSFQPDLQSWQEDQITGNYSGLGFGSNQNTDDSQSALGDIYTTALKKLNPTRERTETSSNESIVHQCPICQKKFKGFYGKYNIKQHLTIHMGVKPYQCDICKKTFNRKFNMEMHKVSCFAKDK